MAKYAQGTFVPKNAQKYVGKHIPRYRSGWELTFMNFCDTNKNVLYWASEAISVHIVIRLLDNLRIIYQTSL